MKLTKQRLEHLILEILREGDVIQGPWKDQPAERGLDYNKEETDFINGIEAQIAKKVSETYGPVEWPVEKIEQLDNLMDGLQDLLKTVDTDA